jgi:hypothetical protein
MADRTSLDLIGFIFCDLSALVIVIAVLIVRSHLDGRLTLEESQTPVVSASLPIAPAIHE